MNFDQWCNEDYDDSENPFEKDSFGYWAYAGWCAALTQTEKEPKGFMNFGDPKNWKEFKNNTWNNSKYKNGCAECGVNASDGYALYCVKCSEPMREWVGLTDEEIAQVVGSPIDEVYLDDFRKVIAKLKEKNT